MGAFANLPIALAPGLGSNAYFAYTVVGFHGSGALPYRTALAAVFLEGLIFLLISVVELRSRLAQLIPKPVRVSTSAGIGLFLTFIGLQGSQGVGLVGFSASTLVTLAACPASQRASVAPVFTFSNGTVALMPGGTVSGTRALPLGPHDVAHVLARRRRLPHHRFLPHQEREGRHDLRHPVRYVCVLAARHRGDRVPEHARRRRRLRLLQAGVRRARHPVHRRRARLSRRVPGPVLGGARHVPVRRHPGHHRGALLHGAVRRVRGRRHGGVRGPVLRIHVRRLRHRVRLAARDVPCDGVHRVVHGDQGGREDGGDGAYGGGVLPLGAVRHAAARFHPIVGGGPATAARRRHDDARRGGGGLGRHAPGGAGVRHAGAHAAHLLHGLRTHRRHRLLRAAALVGLGPPRRRQAQVDARGEEQRRRRRGRAGEGDGIGLALQFFPSCPFWEYPFFLYIFFF
jgi:hypothetical protein